MGCRVTRKIPLITNALLCSVGQMAVWTFWNSHHAHIMIAKPANAGKIQDTHMAKDKFPGTLTYYPLRTPQPAANIAVHENA